MYVVGSGDSFSRHEDHKRIIGNIPAGSYIHSSSVHTVPRRQERRATNFNLT